jgi:hypothetical protein
MEDFYWTILLMEEVLKNDIGDYSVTYPMTAMEVETVIKLRRSANTHLISIYCVCVCVCVCKMFFSSFPHVATVKRAC